MGIGSLIDQEPSRGPVWLLIVLSCGLAVRRPPLFRYVAVGALSLMAGLSAGDRADDGYLARLASNVPSCDLTGAITEHAGKMGTLVRAQQLECQDLAPVMNAGVVIVDDLPLDPGTEVLLKGWVVPLSDEPWDQARARTGAEVAFAATETEVVAAPSGLLGLAAAVRTSLRRATGGLDQRRAALVRGLTIGDTSDLDITTEHEFRRTGLTHLVAVSGSNVAIVLGAAVVLVRRLRPAYRTAFCLATLTFYVLVVGPEPSVLRAAAMGSIVVLGLVWGRRAEPLHALGLALIVLIISRPGISSSVGLHLSAAATGGLVLWARPIAMALGRFIPLPFAWVLGATLAAQVAVAPIMIVVFGEISLVAPLANLLAIPAVAPATVLGLLGAIVGLVLPSLAGLMGGIAGAIAGWIVLVAETLASPSWAAVESPPWVGWALAVPIVGSVLLALGLANRWSSQAVN